MALDQFSLLSLLGELKLMDVTDRIRVATKTLYQEFIDAEAAAFIGAAPFECTDDRSAYCNGTRPRTLSTTAGRTQLSLSVPRRHLLQGRRHYRYRHRSRRNSQGRLDRCDYRTAPLLNVMLTAAIGVSAVSLAVAIVIAVFVDVQSDYLGARSEQTGGFDPSVFPPWNGALWLIGNMFPVLMAILLVILIVARIVAGTGRDSRDSRDSTLDDNLIVSSP